MPVNKGQIYEAKTHAMLKKLGMAFGGAAGASHTLPDITLLQAGKHKSGCELKNQPTAAGSLVMQYIKGKWQFGPVDQDEEKMLLRDIGIKEDVLSYMNGRSHPWGKNNPPVLQYDQNGDKIVNGKPFGSYTLVQKLKFYAQDRKKYPGKNEVKIPVDAKTICNYYLSKGCSYMNVESHGFYTLNGQDDLDLNKFLQKNKYPLIPDFAKSTTASIRVRLQPKGSGGYQFTFTLVIGKTTKSPYNLSEGGSAAKFKKAHLYEALQ